jgi:dipeptidyl aminopeptidase/acylaminoacyl peptidase
MPDHFDLDAFLALPRLSGLRLSADGTRLVVSVGTTAPDGKSMRTALWNVDPAAEAPPRRLTRSAAGEQQAAFAPDGALLFTSSRPDPDAKPGDGSPDEPPAGLWRLDPDGGEAQLLVAPPAGIAGMAVAEKSGALALLIPMHPGAADLDADRTSEQARKDAGVAALLFETYPIQHWDHYLGPRGVRLFAVDAPHLAGPDGDAELDDLEDVTGDTGTALPEPSFDISPDGSLIVSTWHRVVPGAVGDDLVLITRATHGRKHLTNGHGWYGDPVFSPDGRTIAATRGTDGNKDEAPTQHLVLFDVETGDERVVATDLDRWPLAPVWTPDSASVLFTADDLGGVSIYRFDLADGRVTRLTAGGTYHDVSVSPDGSTVYALRSDPDRPWHVVRLDARTADQTPTEIPSPATPESLLPPRGVVERLSATADDGTEIGSWLLRPASASADAPAPLIVFVHGGPLGSWAGWSWRWNANPLVERGYAVLMPDPAISVGYGQHMIDRGWGRWGERPYTDVITAVDGALERPDLDASRTGLMGGSFGGYMANWVAGHTDRFKAIVTHASLWGLRAFHGTTDDGVGWEQELGDPYVDPSRYIDHSPDGEVGAISTPMLVIHGELDARVPISEALRLWTDLWRHDVEAKFLYFPDEGHWVLKPQNTRLWYETVLAFLDQHVLGREWVRPPLV